MASLYDYKWQAYTLIIKIGLHWLSAALIWHKNNLIFACIAYTILHIVDKILLKIYYNKELLRISEGFVVLMQRDNKYNDVDIHQRALELAKEAIVDHMKGDMDREDLM